MEVSIPVNIPSVKEIRGNISSSHSCSRKTSLIECGSFFSASSVNHPRNSVCLSVPMEDPNVERKLSRTRKMSETNRSVDSRRVASIPTQKDDITDPWVFLLVNQYLLKHGKSPLKSTLIQDMKFEVQDCKHSVGDFSLTYALNVSVPNDDEQLCHSFSFIVKMIPENDPCRIYVFETGLFEKENEIYFDFLPAINFYFIKSQTQAIDAGSKTVVDKITPDCFYGSHNMDGAGVLVFQSCSTDNFKECQDPSGLNLEQSKIVIKHMAEFHASSRAFVVKHGVTGVKRRYPMLAQDMYSNGMLIKEITNCLDSYEQFFNSVSESPQVSMAHLKLLECDFIDMKTQFLKLKRCDPDWLLKNLRRSSTTSTSLTTIIHGELWERNIMLDDKHNVKILDWKNTKLASATLDLAFFLLSSTHWELRQNSINDLLELYHKTYVETVAKFKVEIKRPEFQDVLDDFRIISKFASLQALCMFVQEMHYMTQNIAMASENNDESSASDWTNKLKAYEIRALTLFKDLDLSYIEEDDSNTDHIDLLQTSSVEECFDEF